jgi:predicted PurR-regulated permease PerM
LSVPKLTDAKLTAANPTVVNQIAPNSISGSSTVSDRVAESSRLLTLIAVVVVIIGLYFGRQLLIPLTLAIVLAFLLTPVVALLERFRLGRVPSVLLVLILSFAFVGSVGWLVAGQLMDVVEQVPGYKSNIHGKIQSFRVPNASGLSKATNTVTELSNEITAASESAVDKKSAKNSGAKPIPVQVAQPPSNAPQYLRAVIGPLAGIFETSGMVIVFTLFMLIKREDLRNRVIHLAGQGRLNIVTQALDDGSRRLSRYLLLQFLVNTAYGLIFGAAVYWIGVPHALLWGVLAALLRFVPYIGAPIAAAFPIVMAVAVFPGWHQVAAIFALFVFLELIVANVVEPWLYGSNTGISSLAILVAAMFWAILWGPVGLILSTPLTVGLILIGRYVPQLTFLHVLLGDEPVLAPEAHYYQRLLALDQDEARDIANAYLKQHAIGTFYDSVLIPAIALAEKDRHVNSLHAATATFFLQSTKELIEELADRPLDLDKVDPHKNDLDKNKFVSNANECVFDSDMDIGRDGNSTDNGGDDPSHGKHEESRYSELRGLRVVCIPAADEADELVVLMLAHLLRSLGCEVCCLPIAPTPDILEATVEANVNYATAKNDKRVAVISAVPPFAAGQARNICKHLRHAQPELKIVAGLWNFENGVARASDRLGSGCTDLVAVTLEQAVSLLRTTEKTDKSQIPLEPADQQVDPHSEAIVTGP